jgi:hypothetical protein
MSERTEGTSTLHRWKVVTAITVAVMCLLVTFARPQLWVAIPAVAAICLALSAAIKNPDLRTPAGVACVIAALAGGASIILTA